MQAIMECSKFLCNRDDRNILYSGICKTTCDAQIGAGPVCHEWAGGYCRKIQNCRWIHGGEGQAIFFLKSQVLSPCITVHIQEGPAHHTLRTHIPWGQGLVQVGRARDSARARKMQEI